MTSIAEIYELHRVTELLSRLYKGALQLIAHWSILKGKSLYIELVLKVSMYCMFDSEWKNLALICPSPNHLFVISQILKDITRVSLSRSVVTGRREPRERDCCYFPITPPHLYCLPSATIPFVFPPCLQKIMKRYTPNANMADLSVGLGLVARKRG